MGKIENEWRNSLSRRNALRGLAGLLAGLRTARGQQDPFRDNSRIPGIDELATVFDFEPVCYARVPRVAYDYTALGVDGEFTLHRNRQAYEWVELNAGSAVDPDRVQTATEVLGVKMDYPIMIAPSAGHGQLHPDGELATHRGATAAAKTPMIISIEASYPVDKIAAAGDSPLWWQLYGRRTEDGNRELIEAAQSAGCKAIVLTCDVEYTSNRERSSRDRNIGGAGQNSGGGPSPATSSPARRRRPPMAPENPYGAVGQTPYIEWSTIDQLRSITKLPLLLKGVLTAEDAKLAIDKGIEGIIVSNHGGRYLDYAPSTLEVLPEVADAVGGRIPVLFDGGIRRGTDILKALALGAKAVCLGRAQRWGLGAFGEQGVQRVISILQAELVTAMAQNGHASLETVKKSAVRTNFV